MNLFMKILNNNFYKIIELILLSSILPYVVLVLKFYTNKIYYFLLLKLYTTS